MGISGSYRIDKAILCINSAIEGHRISTMIPAGATVTITDGPLNGLRMVDVLWESKTMMLFAVDLRERATLVKKRAADSQ